MWRDQTEEATFTVYYRQRGLLAPYGTPGGHFLVDVRADNRRTGIHDRFNGRLSRRREERLDRQHTSKQARLADDDVTGALESAADQAASNVLDSLEGLHDRHIAGRVPCGRFQAHLAGRAGRTLGRQLS